jgi:hypothetical protein
MMNPVAAVLQRVQQALLKLPRDQFPRSIVFEGWRSEMLGRRDLCLGKPDDLNVHNNDPGFPLPRREGRKASTDLQLFGSIFQKFDER